jgi:hypothetical protein
MLFAEPLPQFVATFGQFCEQALFLKVTLVPEHDLPARELSFDVLP